MQLEIDFGGTKQCPVCNETKGTSEFNKAKSRKDGLQYSCKSCDKERWHTRLAYLVANPPPTPVTKWCNKCKETKVAAEFSKVRANPDGLSRECKSCREEYHRKRLAYLVANPPPTPATKQCNKCKENKVAAEFSKVRANPDGLNNTCKRCDSERATAYTRENSKRNRLAGPPDRTGTKKCGICGETKQKTEFHLTVGTKGGLASACKPCQCARSLQWVKDNPARDNARNARKRAGKLKATPSWEDKRKTLWYYGESQRVTAETGIVHHVDHMVPLNHWSVRGLHWHMNFDVIPGAENSSKGNRRWSGVGWSDWSDYYWEFEEEFVQLKEYAKWLKSLTSHARSVHLATLTTSTQLRAKATVTHVATATATSANEGNNEKTCQASA
jgi:hypothetical protein